MAPIPSATVVDMALMPQVLFLLHFLFVGYVFLLFGSRNHFSSVPCKGGQLLLQVLILPTMLSTEGLETQ